MDLDELRARLDAVLSHRPGAPALRLRGPLVELTGGWASTSVLAGDLSGDDDGVVPAVVKLYEASEEGRRHATREWRALTFLRGTACRVPHVLAVDTGAGELDRPLLLMSRAPGGSAWGAYEAADDDDARTAVIRSFVEQLVALHALDASGLEPTAAHLSPYDALDAELAGLAHDVAAFPRSGLPEVVGWLVARRDHLPCDRPVVLHRDYHPWNTVVDDDDALCVVDWDWGVGDPRFDVAWTCTLVQRSGHDAFSAAVREEYARQSGAALDHLECFEVLATVRWLMDVLPALGADSRLSAAKRADFAAFLVGPLSRARQLLHQHTGVDVELSA